VIDLLRNTQEGAAIQRYIEMKGLLTRKYGRPTWIDERFDAPYYAGDGYEEQAVRVGKGHFYSSWIHPLSHRLYVGLTPGLALGVTYESPRSQAESDQRETRGIDDL
jgi:hypothetical protein